MARNSASRSGSALDISHTLPGGKIRRDAIRRSRSVSCCSGWAPAPVRCRPWAPTPHIEDSRLSRTRRICSSFDCNGHIGHFLKVSNEGSYSLVPRWPLRCRAGAFRAETIRKNGGEFYKAAQSFVEFDALRGRLSSFAVLLSDSPCQVLACRVDSLTYRWWRRQRGRHHRQTRARVAQIECWVTNSRHRPVDQSGEMTPLHQDIGGPQVTVDDRRDVDGDWFIAAQPGQSILCAMATERFEVGGDELDVPTHRELCRFDPTPRCCGKYRRRDRPGEVVLRLPREPLAIAGRVWGSRERTGPGERHAEIRDREGVPSPQTCCRADPDRCPPRLRVAPENAHRRGRLEWPVRAWAEWGRCQRRRGARPLADGTPRYSD